MWLTPYARQWIETYHGRTASGFRPSTRRWYRRVLAQRLIPYFDSRLLYLGDIRPLRRQGVRDVVARAGESRRPGRKLAKASIRHHVAVPPTLLADATEEDLIRTNPAAGVRVAVPGGTLVFTTSAGARIDRRNIYNHVLGPAAAAPGCRSAAPAHCCCSRRSSAGEAARTSRLPSPSGTPW